MALFDFNIGFEFEMNIEKKKNRILFRSGVDFAKLTFYFKISFEIIMLLCE